MGQQIIWSLIWFFEELSETDGANSKELPREGFSEADLMNSLELTGLGFSFELHFFKCFARPSS